MPHFCLLASALLLAPSYARPEPRWLDVRVAAAQTSRVMMCTSYTSTTAPRSGRRTPHDFAVTRTLHVPETVPAGTRLPAALILLAPEEFGSLSSARKKIRRSGALLNGLVAGCEAEVSPGDAIGLQVRVNSGYAPRGLPPFALEILFEDSHVAVVLKPAGVVTHPGPGGADGSQSMRTAVSYALAPPAAGTLDTLARPHLVHRLDKPTAGLMRTLKRACLGHNAPTLHNASTRPPALPLLDTGCSDPLPPVPVGPRDARRAAFAPAQRRPDTTCSPSSFALGFGRLCPGTTRQRQPHHAKTTAARGHMPTLFLAPAQARRQDEAGMGWAAASLREPIYPQALRRSRGWARGAGGGMDRRTN